MTKAIKKLFRKKNDYPEKFSDLFTDEYKAQRKDLLLRAAEAANREQRKVVEEYDKLYGNK